MGCVSCPSKNNLHCMGEVPVIQWGQIDPTLRSGHPASLLPRTTGTLNGVPHREVVGPVLMKADLQLSHYTVGREGQGAAKETSSTGFKHCNSKIHCFVFHRGGAWHVTKAAVCWWPVFWAPSAVVQQQLSPLRNRRMMNPQRSFPRQKDHFGFLQVQQRVKNS